MSETQQIYRIKGMDCADCARTIEAGVKRLEGVESLHAQLRGGATDGRG